MRVIRRFAVLAMLALVWWGSSQTKSIYAQSGCNFIVQHLWAAPCSTPQTACKSSASATLMTCNTNCDSQYGPGTSGDKTCRANCTTTYNKAVAACNTDYNSCINLRQNACQTECTIDCGGTTGYTCCTYLDSSTACSYSCGCQMPPPPCSGAVCVGGSWSCQSPVILDVSGNGFHLTSPEDGVWFDLAMTGYLEKWSWTDQNAANGFLVLDRNGNGVIDDGAELFGSHTPQPPTSSPNGFLALAVYDRPENGGNDDGFIDSHDAIYSQLRVWIDKNHDGVSQPDELHSLSDLGIARIDLNYQVKSRTDEYGNDFHYRSRVWDSHGQQGGRWAWDVYLHRDLDAR